MTHRDYFLGPLPRDIQHKVLGYVRIDNVVALRALSRSSRTNTQYLLEQYTWETTHYARFVGNYDDLKRLQRLLEASVKMPRELEWVRWVAAANQLMSMSRVVVSARVPNETLAARELQRIELIPNRKVCSPQLQKGP